MSMAETDHPDGAQPCDGLASCPDCSERTLDAGRFCAFCGVRLKQAPTRCPVSPVPPRDALAGPCVLMRVGGKELDIPSVGREIAAVLKKPLPDVTRAMRISHGVIARGVEAEQAREIAHRIEGGGAKVLVLDESQSLTLVEPMRMHRAAFSRFGLECEAYSWDDTQEIEQPWERILLVSCGRLALASLAEVPEPESPMALRRRKGDRLVHATRYEFVLDLFHMSEEAPAEGGEITGAIPHLRLDENEAAFSLTKVEAAGQSDVALHRAALQVDRFADGVAMNPGLHLLARDASAPLWEPFTFATKADFDAYNTWLLHLIKYSYWLS